MEAQCQLNLNEQEDSAAGQELLTKNNGPRENLNESRSKVLTPEIPLDGPSGTPACFGHTGRHNLPTQIGPPTRRKPDCDASPVKPREKAGITKDGEKVTVTRSPTRTSTDTGRPKLRTSGIEREIPKTETGMDKLEKPNTEDTPLLIFSTMDEEMNKCRDDTQDGVLQASPTTQPQEKAAGHEPGAGDLVVPQVKDFTQRTVITGNRRTLLRCGRPPTCSGSARGQRVSQGVIREEVSQVNYGS